MTVAHKDFGRYDSEADRTPEPPGFAYMASPEQGRNQYGYWEHREGGSFWAWLPEYLILRDLLSNRTYQPVPSSDWLHYRQTQRAGGTYYGHDAQGAPKYGSSGTFTRKSYADSRYVQHGGFSASSYASRSFGGAASSSTHATSPSGQRFGSRGRAGGMRFGSRSRGAGRSFGRGFGRR